MQIVTVAPIVRGVLKERLSYFSKEPLELGMVIVAPVRTREIPAIVLETRIVSDEKSTIKSSDYAIRKITRAHPRRIWTPEFLKAIEETANYSAQKFGESLLTLTPKVILDSHLEGILPEPEILEKRSAPRTHLFALQGDTKTRMEHWERLVRESFARDESVFICLPTEDDVLRVSEKLERGIADYAFAFYGSFAKKKTLERWRLAVNEKHAVLVVGTAQYLGLPRYFKTIVLDEEHSHAWKTISRPLIDLRFFVESYARQCGSTLIIGAPLLRAETQARILLHEIEEYGRIAARSYADIETEITDPRVEEKTTREETGKRSVVILTVKLLALIEDARAKGESVLLIAARKGLSPVTSCGDCGALVRCPECDTPLVIHKRKAGHDEAQVFVCHSCSFMRTPEDNVHEVCKQCGSWKLEGIGIGTDRIGEEIVKYFPSVPRFILDGDHAGTHAQAKKIVQQFNKTPGSILIATPMVLPLIDTVSHAAIVSIDSLFSIPDIRMPERIFTLILALREKTSRTLVTQTRADNTDIFAQALSGDLAQFTKNELALRKAFFYPPYGIIIKITLRGKRNEISQDINRLQQFFEQEQPIVSGTMHKEPKNIFRMHMILKLPPEFWPSSDLLAKLRALPPQMSIEINPNNLL